MKKHAFAALLASLFMITAFVNLILQPCANAITYGEIDNDNSYSNTGAFVIKSAKTERIFIFCSGTLIASNVFLTAAHCTESFLNDYAPNGFTAWVSFDQSIPFRDNTDLSKTNLIPVDNIITNPNYNRRRSDSGDIAVLILPGGTTGGITPATLPRLGYWTNLRLGMGLKTHYSRPLGTDCRIE